MFLKKRKITKKDFVYMDPPYISVNKTSFVDYNKQGFNHDELIELCNTMKNVSFVQSNSYCDKTKNGYKAFQQHHVVTKRRINSKNHVLSFPCSHSRTIFDYIVNSPLLIQYMGMTFGKKCAFLSLR